MDSVCKAANVPALLVSTLAPFDKRHERQ